MPLRAVLLPWVLLTFLAAGCSPVTTGIKLGAKVVGTVVNDKQTQDFGRQLVDQPPSAADQLLGSRANVLRDVNGRRMWLVYPAKLGPPGMSRHVVAVANNRIVSVEMVSQGVCTALDMLDVNASTQL